VRDRENIGKEEWLIMRTSWIAVVTVLAIGTLSMGTSLAQEDTKLKDALAMMKEKSAALGAPKAEGVSLLFGTTKVNGNYDIVDAIKEKFGCVATFFVKKGDGFIRISTNVQKEGNRAVGTPLDPEGPAMKAVSKGETYQGEADILGAKHSTIYEPIKDAQGTVVGLYFVGLPQK
jgi:hypothetical protein